MFEYGEVLYRPHWIHYRGDVNKYRYRFRMGPVPGLYDGKKYWFPCWYKTGTNCLPEKRVYHEHREYVRGKRSIKNLPNDWNDYQRSDVKTRYCWKRNKVKKQWMKNLSGKCSTDTIRNMELKEENVLVGDTLMIGIPTQAIV